MIKLLGVIDLITAIFYILAVYNIGINIALVLAVILMVKALLFIKSWSSWVDLIVGGYLFLIIYDVSTIFAFIGFVWLIQKSFFSLTV